VTPWVRRLIIANVLVFFLEQTVRGIVPMLAFTPRLALYMPWTIVTYMFVHDQNGITHILFNMLGLYFFGPKVEERLGAKRFLALYFISGISGALLSFIFAYNSSVVGASGALFGVMIAFAMYWPEVQILFMFFLPVPARVAVGIMTVMSLWSGIQGSRGGVADFAHLGGFLGGFIYLKWLERRAGTKRFRTKTVTSVPRGTLANYKKIDTKSIHEVNRDEVNRILDKINDKGMGSLTPQEKLFLSNFVPPDDRVPPPT
jgi:membrane associated rhomboid family serine protease